MATIQGGKGGSHEFIGIQEKSLLTLSHSLLCALLVFLQCSHLCKQGLVLLDEPNVTKRCCLILPDKNE